MNNHQIITLDKKGSIISENITEGIPEKIKTLSEKNGYWVSTLTETGSTLELMNQKHEMVVKILAESRIRDIAHSNGISVVGLDDGRVIAIEQKMLGRRIEETQQSDEDGDVRRSDMRERLRNLRK